MPYFVHPDFRGGLPVKVCGPDGNVNFDVRGPNDPVPEAEEWKRTERLVRELKLVWREPDEQSPGPPPLPSVVAPSEDDERPSTSEGDAPKRRRKRKSLFGKKD